MARGRTALIDRPMRLETTLPTSIYMPVHLHLYSELEGKVPQGAWQRFLIERIKEFFSTRVLDLEPFGFPPATYARVRKEDYDRLRAKLLDTTLEKEA